jgi:hypothetical protein
VIHVRGKNRLFSCYDVDDHLLAFYTERSGMALDGLNMAEADSAMINIVTNLRELIRNGG